MINRTRRDSAGNLASLLDLGYNNVGLDDNWQACGEGYEGSFHDLDGNPLINKTRFPSMQGMTNYGHSVGLRMGWYMNNCICLEDRFRDLDYVTTHMEASARAVAEYGFDSVKLDGCGQFRVRFTFLRFFSVCASLCFLLSFFE